MIMKLIEIMIQLTSDNKTWGKNEFKKFAIFFNGNCQLVFSSKIKMSQLGSFRLGTSVARLEPENSSSGSSQQICVISEMHLLYSLNEEMYVESYV